MGKAERKTHRALALIESTYAREIQPFRLALSERRADRDEMIRIHRAALASCLRAADREGGPGWMVRSGRDRAGISLQLWSDHIAPLSGLDAHDVPGITDPEPHV